MDLDAISDRIAEVHRGRKWILVPDAAAPATPLVEQLRDWGASGIMVIAGIEGVGELPNADRIHYTRASGDTMMGGIRSFIASVEHPSHSLIEAVDAFDPDGEAYVLDMGFNRADRIADRPIYGARRPEWSALEDKMIIDDLWDAAGVTRAPSAVVPVEGAAAAADRLATDLGTVWVADNKEGWHGGAEYVRWIRGPGDVPSAVAWFADHADRVRVMPFLDGQPCSIHGFVTRNGVSVFLPVEMIMLRRTDRPEFFYGGAANFWTPPAGVRLEMRAAAKSAGSLIADRLGYLGGFGIDGVCTQDGFRPTELNPRLSAGHGLQSRAAKVRLGSMQRLMIEGDLEVDAADLETTLVEAAEHRRQGSALFPLTGTYPSAKIAFTFEDGIPVTVDPDEPNDGTMQIGPAAFGSIVIVTFDPERTPVGPRTTPSALRLLQLAQRLWDIDVPALAAPSDLCPADI
jgi:hypothetical protein